MLARKTAEASHFIEAEADAATAAMVAHTTPARTLARLLPFAASKSAVVRAKMYRAITAGLVALVGDSLRFFASFSPRGLVLPLSPSSARTPPRSHS